MKHISSKFAQASLCQFPSPQPCELYLIYFRCVDGCCRNRQCENCPGYECRGLSELMELGEELSTLAGVCLAAHI